MIRPDLVPLTRETIDTIFDAATDQWDAFIALYKVAHPDLDTIKSLERWPHVATPTSDYIFKKFITLDCKYHPDVLHGGLWMNSGFTWDPTIPDWYVQPTPPEHILRKV
jgi:hypothetical protein